ncbi:hypothetical protein Tco_1362975 [Tanacetum coccineum]
MLTPRSAKALQEKVLLKVDEMRKLPGSLSLGGTFLAFLLKHRQEVLLCLVLVFDGKTYDLPINPNDQPNDSETPINFDSDDEDDEPTPQPKPKESKLVKETPIAKPYKPKIPYPQRLRKEKIESQYGKFLDMIRAVRINVPLVNVLAKMPNMANFSRNSINVTNEILEENFDALLDEGSKILHSIKGTILEEKLFAEFDEFMAMTTDENSESEIRHQKTTI